MLPSLPTLVVGNKVVNQKDPAFVEEIHSSNGREDSFHEVMVGGHGE